MKRLAPASLLAIAVTPVALLLFTGCGQKSAARQASKPVLGNTNPTTEAGATGTTQRTRQQIEYAMKLGKNITKKQSEKEFLKLTPDAKKNRKESNPQAGVVAYDSFGGLDQDVFKDGKLIVRSFTIPRTAEGFDTHHAEIMNHLGVPDSEVLNNEMDQNGVLYNFAWRLSECDLQVVYVARKLDRKQGGSDAEYVQTFSVGSIKALDELEQRSK